MPYIKTESPKILSRRFWRKTYHEALNCFSRNRPIEINVTSCQSNLSVQFESRPREGLVISIKSHYCTVTVFNHLHYSYCKCRRSCFRNPIRTSQRIPGRSPNAPAVEITAFIPFRWKATEIFAPIGNATARSVVWSWKENALRRNQYVKRR